MTRRGAATTGLRFLIFYVEYPFPKGKGFPYKLWVCRTMVVVTGSAGSSLDPVNVLVMQVQVAVSKSSISRRFRF